MADLQQNITIGTIEEAVWLALKKTLLGVLCLFGVQILVAVWAASNLWSQVQSNKENVSHALNQISHVEATRYKDRDAQKDFALRDIRITAVERDMNDIKTTLIAIRNHQDSLLNKLSDLTSTISKMEAVVSAETNDRKEIRTWMKGLAERIKDVEKSSNRRQ